MNENYTNTYIINCSLESYAFFCYFLELQGHNFIKGRLFSNKNQEKFVFMNFVTLIQSPGTS